MHEPHSVQEATEQVLRIVDSKYEITDLQSVVSTNCSHFSLQDQNRLLELLTEYEELFDGTLGDWNTDPMSFELMKAPGHIMEGHTQN